MEHDLKDLFERTETLSFDCYGTLVDWETGLRDYLAAHFDPDATHQASQLFETYLQAEASIEGEGWQPYRDVIAKAVRRAAERLAGGEVAPVEVDVPGLVARWEPYPDTVEALARLKRRFRLGVLSNVDGDLFATTAPKLGVELDFVVTADEVHAYKPSHLHFHRLVNAHAQRETVLHVAQSLFHDAVPAGQLGIPFVWINRRGEVNESPAKLQAEFPTLLALAERVDELLAG